MSCQRCGNSKFKVSAANPWPYCDKCEQCPRCMGFGKRTRGDDRRFVCKICRGKGFRMLDAAEDDSVTRADQSNPLKDLPLPGQSD